MGKRYAEPEITTDNGGGCIEICAKGRTLEGKKLTGRSKYLTGSQDGTDLFKVEEGKKIG